MCVRIVVKQVEGKGNDGKKKVFNNYYLVTENGQYIAFKPSFVNDYGKLRIIAEKVNEKE